MFKKIIGKYIFIAPSIRKGKKYSVFNINGKYITSFGALGYEHYKDKIGFYSKLNHLSKERKRLYYSRHGKTEDNTSAKYFASKYLW